MADSEDKLQEKMFEFLSRYFNVEREVRSIDRKCRIDLVLVHKSDTLKECPIGIEVKIDAKKTGKDLASWMKQAQRYVANEFENYGKLLIITYPQISVLYLREGFNMSNHEDEGSFQQHNNVGTFFSQFGIGELQKYRSDKLLRIVYRSFIIWDMYYDEFRFDNYKKFMK